MSTKRSWTWGSSQEQAFSQVKSELAKPTVLALYSPRAPTKVSADASSYGLGAVLLQQVVDVWKPVAYASRSMSETERRYAQIEKEALAVTWACDKFSDYILGRPFQIETDHKPLVPLLSTKQLNSLPPRVLRFRLRLARYDYSIQHVPSKLLYTADALSRAPLTEVESLELQEEVEAFIESVSDNLPASKGRLETYQEAQSSDSVCSRVKEFCTTGWPKKHLIGAEIRPFWKVRKSLSLHNGLLLFNSRIVVPSSLQEETLERIHEGHQGIERCRIRINSSVWWPGVSLCIAEKVQNCTTCAKDNMPRREPLLITPLPDYPWQIRVLSTGGSRGEASPPNSPASPPTDLPVIVHIRLAFISSLMPVLITQELKFSLFKLSQVIKCFSFRASRRRDHIPTPYSYIVNDGFPSKF